MSTTETTPSTNAALPWHAVTQEVTDRAELMFNRGYEITGYVLTQKISSWRAVVDTTGVRWMSPADMTRLMGWKEPTGSGAPPDGSLTDNPASVTVLPVPSVVVAPPRASKAVLTTSASHEQLTDAEQAMALLAERLGCIYNDAIPHNTGWFVPGNQVAYCSALDAIEALVTSLKQGGTVYQPVSEKVSAVPPTARDQQQDRRETSTQQALF